MPAVVNEFDVPAGDGRTLHAYDTGGDDRLAVIWHHGTPNIGSPPEPLFDAADHLGIRWVSYDRPGYGGSTPRPGRTIGSAADDACLVAGALGIGRFAVMGHSGGGSHALACGARLADRVAAVVSVSGLAPFGAAGLDWFAGMGESGEASLRAARDGRAAKESFEATAAETAPDFTAADWATLSGDWSWLGKVAGKGMAAGPGGLIDDDLAYVAPWGCDPADVTAPVLIAHGDDDRIVPVAHAAWLADRCASAELRVAPGAGHISVLTNAVAALEWLRDQAGG